MYKILRTNYIDIETYNEVPSANKTHQQIYLRLFRQMPRRLPKDHLAPGQSAHLDLCNHYGDHL